MMTFWLASRALADSERAYPREPEQIILAWLLIAQGEPVQAVGLLERLLEVAEAQGRQGRAIEILTLLALAWQAQNKPAPALDALARALILAEPASYIRTFVDKGWPMATLVRRVTSPGVVPVYVAKLLAAFDATVAQATRTMPPRFDVPSLTQPLVEPLSERELEALRRIAAGLSNREIAAQLVITVGTAV